MLYIEIPSRTSKCGSDQFSVYCQPNTGWINSSSFHPVTFTSRDKNPVTCYQDPPSPIFPQQLGLTLEQHHPFVPFLFIPEPRWRTLPGRNYPFNQDSPVCDKGFTHLPVRKTVREFKNIIHFLTSLAAH